MLVALLGGAVLGGVWLAQLGKGTVHALDAALARLEADNTGNASRLQALQQRLDKLTEEQAAAGANRTELETRLGQLVQRLDALPTARDAAWTPLQLAEIDTLLNLAEQRLVLARDLPGAAAALAVAIARAPMDATALKEALRADFTQLKTYRDRDVAALARDFARLAEAAGEWPMRRARAMVPATAAATAESPMPDGWRGVLAAIWRDLRSLVEIHPASDGPDPLLEPERIALVRQQLAMALTTARIAVLARDDAVRGAALQAARSLLDQSFDTQQESVAQALAWLQGDAAVPLNPALPTLDASRQALAAAKAGSAP